MDPAIDDARTTLGAVGAHVPSIGLGRANRTEVLRDAIGRLEGAGFPAAWTNEGVGGVDAFVQASLLLAAGERIAVGTDVANIWARAPQTAHAATTQLADAHPGRFVLGLGAGYPFQASQVGAAYRPLSAMREYLDAMGRPPPVDQPLDVRVARVVAANGPKMVALARDAADGAIPGMVPPAATGAVRAALGPERLLVVALVVVVDDDRAAARRAAQDAMAPGLGTPGSPFAANLVRLGYAEQDVRAAAGPVLDEVIAAGTGDDVAERVEAHRAAGADHVVLQPIVGGFEQQLRQLERLAATLLPA